MADYTSVVTSGATFDALMVYLSTIKNGSDTDTSTNKVFSYKDPTTNTIKWIDIGDSTVGANASKLQGNIVSSTTPTENQIWKYLSSTGWTPSDGTKTAYGGGSCTTNTTISFGFNSTAFFMALNNVSSTYSGYSFSVGKGSSKALSVPSGYTYSYYWIAIEE